MTYLCWGNFFGIEQVGSDQIPALKLTFNSLANSIEPQELSAMITLVYSIEPARTLSAVQERIGLARITLRLTLTPKLLSLKFDGSLRSRCSLFLFSSRYRACVVERNREACVRERERRRRELSIDKNAVIDKTARVAWSHYQKGRRRLEERRSLPLASTATETNGSGNLSVVRAERQRRRDRTRTGGGINRGNPTPKRTSQLIPYSHADAHTVRTTLRPPSTRPIRFGWESVFLEEDILPIFWPQCGAVDADRPIWECLAVRYS
ncbi:uncharacterized protein LOC143214123 [Lasioglossum baleicum]|uniref:uncharacterized protein LOC143214123 n=1 Tax=Lasioglossum baleicum TaxID=434251 RepID=UPI003FCE5C63